MEYSFNLKGDNFVYAQKYEINASPKDLAAVCDVIRYVNASRAVTILDRVVAMQIPIPYRRHNKHMGSRSELGGQKGKYPRKAAAEVREALVNAISNANNRGLDGEDLVVVHASANKTHIESRYPSKGSIAWGRGMYGRSAMNHSNLVYAKVEIVLGEKDDKKLSKNMKYFIIKKERAAKATGTQKAAPAKKVPQKKEEKAKKTESKPAAQKEQPKQQAPKTPTPAQQKPPEPKVQEAKQEAKDESAQKNSDK